MTDHSMDTVSPDGASADTGVSPEIDVAAGQVTEAGTPAAPEVTPPAEPDAKPEGKPDHWATRRLGQYAEKVREREAAIAERDARIAEYERRLNPNAEAPAAGQAPTRAPSEAQIRADVEQKMAIEHWDAEGIKASPTFRADCQKLAALGATENPAALRVLMDVEDSPGLIAKLAADEAEAERILALPAHKMAFALAKFAAKAPTPPPVSKAPPPLTPVAGAAKVDADPSNMSMSEWMKWREKQLGRK